MTALTLRPVFVCAWVRLRRAAAPLALSLSLVPGLAVPVQADEPVRGTVSVFTDGGYTRLLFRLEEEVPARVSVAGSIMVISFKKPVQVGVDRLSDSARDYISVARRDPDGTAIRIALARKVKVNTIPAGDRFYVDLLPDTWTGILPGLPQEVVDDLARRARDAEKLLYQHKIIAKQKEPPLMRVRVARQPTFIRYVFEMPDTANVVPDESAGKLTLNFDQAIRWDLADAKATMPPTVEAVDATNDFSSGIVTFTLNGSPEVRTFREDRSVVVDIGTGSKPSEASAASGPVSAPSIDAPETIPAAKDAVTPAPKADSKSVAPKGEALKPDVAPAPRSEAPKVEAPKADASKPAPPKVAAQSTPPQAPEQPKAVADAAPKEAAKEPAKPAVKPAKAPSDANNVVVGVQQSGNALSLDFPFAAPTPAAAFRRGDTVWLIFDTDKKIDIAALTADKSGGIRAAKLERGSDGEAILRIRLARPRLVSLAADGPEWLVTIADAVTTPTQPLSVTRSLLGKAQTSIAMPFDGPGRLHVLKDSDVGSKLMVVTGLGPARGFLKQQDFVEIRALVSTHGIVVEPLADDIAADVEADRVTFSRPGGLSLSPTDQAEEQIASTFRSLTFDPQTWGYDRQAAFNDRQSELIRLAAGAPEAKRKQARLNLARFYLARDMAAEAKGVIDVALGDQQDGNDVTGSVLRAVANVMLDRPQEALKALSAPPVANQQDAPIWRAVAFAREGKWPEAREAFKGSEAALGTLPLELQRIAMLEALRSAIEVRDFTAASRLLNDFETAGIPADIEPTVKVLAGRLNEGLGRKDDAIASYRAAADASDRRAASQARLREIALLQASGGMPRKDAIVALETLTAVWRGDETEAEGLKLLAQLYTEENRYRDAFHVMRTALRSNPNSDMTRKIQDEAAATFDSLFLEGKGDTLPPVEALGLFYDYRELTPIGRRGDEMIRRLADRLVSVDLLDQAAELLQHQVDHRLQGAARAQVATRLALIYLMNRRPERALATLQSTRMGDLSNEIRDQRLLLESRAMSDIGRHELALELIANVKGPEATRLRSDTLWAAQRWREAAEQIELLLGDRWRDFAPLSDDERSDVLRAAVGYTMSDETIGIGRLREKFAAKMAESPDARAFEVASAPIGADRPEFLAVAKRLAAVDTLQAFLRDMRKRYPEQTPPTPSPSAANDAAAQAKKEAAAVPAEKPAVNAPADPSSPPPPKAPAGVPLRPDMTPTGSITKPPAQREAAR
ncbi:hypothetical protein MXD81_58365 [Microbacteriaceae bacterium K1510]|nr:hypothetical protein [Microbacteriaceae bacterium K1510]